MRKKKKEVIQPSRFPTPTRRNFLSRMLTAFRHERKLKSVPCWREERRTKKFPIYEALKKKMLFRCSGEARGTEQILLLARDTINGRTVTFNL